MQRAFTLDVILRQRKAFHVAQVKWVHEGRLHCRMFQPQGVSKLVRRYLEQVNS